MFDVALAEEIWAAKYRFRADDGAGDSSFAETAARVANTGTQPEMKLRHAPLPSTPANPTAMTLAKTKKLATLEPEAIKAAAGVGAPS